MKVYSKVKPSNYFYHILPTNPLITVVRFCENPMDIDGMWEYDEYSVEISTCDNVEEYILNHLNELKADAIGGASIIEQLCAKLDYISMMAGIDIPTNEEGVSNE